MYIKFKGFYIFLLILDLMKREADIAEKVYTFT